MTDQKTKSEIFSIERRNFMKLAASGGFTAAVVAGAAGVLSSSDAVAQTRKEEAERESAADHVMTIATAYVLGATRSYPIMQLDFKENIQNATDGKVYVKLAPGGQLGAGALWLKRCKAAQSRRLSTRCPTSPPSRLSST